MKPVLILLALLLLASCAGCGGDQPPSAYQQEIDTWHADREERLAAADGWLTLVGLHPLPEGVNTVGTGADNDIVLDLLGPATLGTLELSGDKVRFVPAAGAGVTIDDEDLTRPTHLSTDAEGAPTVVRVNTGSFLVIARGDRHFLRVKDNASPVRTEFQGVPRFPVDESWRVIARLESENMPTTVPITNVLGQVEQQLSPGVLVFELDGRPHRLIPVGEPGKSIFVVFGDASNGKETYGGGRFLSADPPDAEGKVVLDVNKATNPPCSFTPYATCPLPPRENVLPVAVTAGERHDGERH